LRIANDRDIAAFAFHFRFSERDKQFFIRRFYHSFGAVEQLGFED
jgi:hypothetical protein